MVVALAVAFANEGLTAAEKKAVARIAEAADFSSDRLDALTKKVRAQAGTAEEVRNSLTPGPPSSRRKP
jgi:hypothetical protein